METLSYYGARFVGGEENCNLTFQMTDRQIQPKFNHTFILVRRQKMDDMTYSDNFFSKWVNRSGGGPSFQDAHGLRACSASVLQRPITEPERRLHW